MVDAPPLARRGLGLRVKFVLPLIAIVGLVIGGVIYMWVSRLEQILNDSYRDKALSIAQLFDTIGPLQEGIPDTQRHIDDLMALNPDLFRITVYALVRGQITRLASSDHPLIGTPADPEDAESISTNQPTITDTVEEGEPVMEVLAPLHFEGKPVASVGIYMRLAPRNQVLAEQRNIALIAAVVAIFLIIILALILANYFIVRPLHRLWVATAAVARGQLGQTVEPLSNDEIGKLGAAFNRMSLSLQNWEERNQQLRRELEAKYLEVRDLSVVDSLTGLYNHRYFQEELAKEMQRCRRFGHSLALLFCDLDGLKPINDAYGHIVGDRVLRDVAHIMGQSVRKIDTAARYGGDEFVAILPETSTEGASQLAQRLRLAVAEHICAGDGGIEVGVTLSIGIAVSPRDGQHQADLVDKADQAMFAAKRLGGNRYFDAGQLSLLETTNRDNFLDSPASG